jgi:oxygen-independent coproporphyrinogen-3 oxidase
MSGIYIHIPFCRKACHYCNFHFSTSLALQKDFTTALLFEIDLQKNYLNKPVSTIYFGGGTPSLMPADDLAVVLKKLYSTFIIEGKVELTLEANPDDITNEKLKEWKQLGFNRLSIGVQSFFEEDLTWMNRAHNAEQAANCIHLAQQEGFNNLTIDLIYGTPTLSDEHWKKNVQKAISLNIPHLSCYALTVEPKTALDILITAKKMQNVDPDKQSAHFEQLMNWMEAAGYEHYEISNFAKPGFESKHNSSYWQGKQYLGLGPSAHSFNGSSRQWNVANNALYINALKAGNVPFEVEHLTQQQQLNEYIMTSLRTKKGISLLEIEDRFNKKAVLSISTSAKSHLKNETVELSKNYLKLTKKGKFLADGIAADLFV